MEAEALAGVKKRAKNEGRTIDESGLSEHKRPYYNTTCSGNAYAGRRLIVDSIVTFTPSFCRIESDAAPIGVWLGLGRAVSFE